MKPYCGDWKNTKDYPPIGCSNNEWLAWEFIRRNANYAKEVEMMMPFLESGEFANGFKFNSDSVLDGVVCWPEAMPGETAKQYYRRMRIEKVKSRRIVKPAHTFSNRWCLVNPVLPDTKYESGLVKFEQTHIRLKRTSGFTAKNFRLILQPNEIAVRFRLDLPIRKQLIQANDLLKLEASKYDERQKLLTDNEQKKFVANANNEHTKSVFSNANFWLRSFDACKQPAKLTNNPKARLEQEDGSGIRRKMFNVEIKLKNSEKLDKEKKIAELSLSIVKGFQGLADDYIYGKKFQKLLYVESKPIQVEKTNQKNALFEWPSLIKSDNESPSL